MRLKKLLPDKPSALIRLALADLEATEKMPEYHINMREFHEGMISTEFKCEVCFAGAVMARTIKVSPFMNAMPDDFDDATEAKLNALDAFRSGDIEAAFVYLDIATLEHLKGIYNDLIWDAEGETTLLHALSVNPKTRPLWKLYMQDLAGILEAEGY